MHRAAARRQSAPAPSGFPMPQRAMAKDEAGPKDRERRSER
jgi:hypothetical protein